MSSSLYLQRIKQLSERLEKSQLHSTEEEELLAQRGYSLLMVGDLNEALSDYLDAEELRNLREPKRRIDGYLKKIGVIRWLQGNHQEARLTWLSIMEDIKARNIVYSDFAGGVLNATLLWFASISLQDGKYIDLINEFLQSKVETIESSVWPAPIALFILGKISGATLIDYPVNEPKALQSRMLCQAYFYTAVPFLDQGNKPEFVLRMQKAIEQGEQNPLEEEYFLARHEYANKSKAD